MLIAVSAVRVEQHPAFVAQYLEMSKVAADSEAQLAVFGDVTALVGALEDFGHAIRLRTTGAANPLRLVRRPTNE